MSSNADARRSAVNSGPSGTDNGNVMGASETLPTADDQSGKNILSAPIE